MDGNEGPLKDMVGIILFSRIVEDLYSVALQKQGEAWTYFGGEKLEGEPDIVAAQRYLRESLGVFVGTQDLVPFARTSAASCRCALFATVLYYRAGPFRGAQWALSQLPKYVSEMAVDVPVLVEMAKIALMFPDEIFFTAEMT